MKPTTTPSNHLHQLRRGACGYPHGSLPLKAEGGGKLAVSGRRVVQRDAYPGDREDGSFVVLKGVVHPLQWREGEWQVQPQPGEQEWCGLDAWLDVMGADLLADRQACLAYGSNLCAKEIAKFAGENPAVVLSGLLLGAAAAYCSTSRSDSQFPAGVVATTPSCGELHGLVLVDAEQRKALDAKEGVSGGYYQSGVLSADSVDFVLENGTRWHGPLGVYLQGARRSLALHEAAPVLLTEVDQRDFTALSIHGSTDSHGVNFEPVSEFPPLSAAGIPLFSYGTLQPEQFRHRWVADFVDELSRDSVRGTIVDTGQNYPGLVSSSDGEVPGTLLYPKSGQELPFLAQCDAIEGHPHLFYRALTRTASGTLAWVYFWQSTDADAVIVEADEGE